MTASSPTRILAKSGLHGRGVTLEAHTQSVLEAVRAMFGRADSPTRLARHWLRFFRLPDNAFTAFYWNTWLAAAFHDIGKANDGFQSAVTHHGEQLIRHEHLSGLLLSEASTQSWLRSQAVRGVDPEIVMAAVVSHHLKVDVGHFAHQLVPVDRAAVRVFAGSPDVAAVLSLAAAPLGAAPPDLNDADRRWDFSAEIQPARGQFLASMHGFERALRRDERRRRLLLAVKAAVIAVDSAGSAATRTGLDLTGWLNAALRQQPLSARDIEELVIGPRVLQLQRSGRWDGFHDFQLAAATLGTRALLLSGCGTGKTLAAWRWAASQLDSFDASRVLFLYPTRATATEGFRDYVSWAGPDEAALLSGTSAYDLTGMFGNPGDPRSAGDYSVAERLFALAYWDRRIFSATVDSFLAMMANRYAALCMVPLLADAVLIVDEVHSFSRGMFRALERFLKFFDAPTLCMTASLTEDRLAVLHDSCGLEVFPSSADAFEDLQRQSRAPRYEAHWIECEEAEDTAAAALGAGTRPRVLWVVNTVRRCQEVARRMEVVCAGAAAVLCYHSRFRLVDRKARHDQVIATFRGPAQSLLLVTTQVCEMSLDLDADVLITEAAPVPALIQRMGRCCREPLPPAGRRGEVYIYRPIDARPYETAEVDQGEAFARWLASRGEAAHADLGNYLADVDVREPFVRDGFSGFLDSGWYAMARDDSFREDDAFTVDCVLDTDREAYIVGRRNRDQRAMRFIVPVPRRLARSDPTLGAYIYLAPSARYDRALGFVASDETSNA